MPLTTLPLPDREGRKTRAITAQARPEVAAPRPEVAAPRPEVAAPRPEVAAPRPEVAAPATAWRALLPSATTSREVATGAAPRREMATAAALVWTDPRAVPARPRLHLTFSFQRAARCSASTTVTPALKRRRPSWGEHCPCILPTGRGPTIGPAGRPRPTSLLGAFH